MDIFTAYELFKQYKSLTSDYNGFFSNTKPHTFKHKGEEFTFDLRDAEITEDELEKLYKATEEYTKKINRNIPWFSFGECIEWVAYYNRKKIWLFKKKIYIEKETDDMFKWLFDYHKRIQNICYKKEKLNYDGKLFNQDIINHHIDILKRIAFRKKDYEDFKK
jgi:hypothetical protein